jgi:hypothetical protein
MARARSADHGAGAAGQRPTHPAAASASGSGGMSSTQHSEVRHIMGKYLVGWLLGVPAFVLVLVWFFFG